MPMAGEWAMAQLVGLVRQRVRGLRHRPSPHAPELAEGETPTPLHVLADQPDIGILIKPDEGTWISLVQRIS